MNNEPNADRLDEFRGVPQPAIPPGASIVADKSKLGHGKKILRIPETFVLQYLAPIQGNPVRHVPFNTIPPGCAVLCVHHNWECRAFDFTLQHASFEYTEPGSLLPVINPTWQLGKAGRIKS